MIVICLNGCVLVIGVIENFLEYYYGFKKFFFIWELVDYGRVLIDLEEM